MDNVTGLIKKCNLCKRDISDDGIFLQHKLHGIVCEYCPEFADGGITPIESNDRPRLTTHQRDVANLIRMFDIFQDNTNDYYTLITTMKAGAESGKGFNFDFAGAELKLANMAAEVAEMVKMYVEEIKK